MINNVNDKSEQKTTLYIRKESIGQGVTSKCFEFYDEFRNQEMVGKINLKRLDEENKVDDKATAEARYITQKYSL